MNTILTPQQKILKYKQYTIYTKALQEIFILKREGIPYYRNSNRNHAIKKLDTLQTKLIQSRIDDWVDGTGKNINTTKTVNNIVTDTLEQQRKELIKKDNSNADKITIDNISKYSEILNNRIYKEQERIDNRIDNEISKINNRIISSDEAKKYLEDTILGGKNYKIQLVDRWGNVIKNPEQYSQYQLQFMGANYKKVLTGSGKKMRSISNIIKDALHTNENSLSLSAALESGYKYKVWNNGRSKGKTRAWHKANVISSVEIEDVFEIFGSYPAYLMYPGDLNGGAENVANCRCWLSYTNERPSDLKTHRTYNINNSNGVNLPFSKPSSKVDVSTDVNVDNISTEYRVSKGKKVNSNNDSIVGIVSNKKGVSSRIKKILNKLKTKIQNIPKKIKQRFKLKNNGLSDFFIEDFEEIKIDNVNYTKYYNNYLNHFEDKISNNLIEITSENLAKFKEKIKGVDFEVALLYDWKMNLKYFLSDEKEASVKFSEEVKKYGKKEGYYLVVHNHPRGVGLPSIEDMEILVDINPYIFEIVPKSGTKSSTIINNGFSEEDKSDILKEHRKWLKNLKEKAEKDVNYKEYFEKIDSKYNKNLFEDVKKGDEDKYESEKNIFYGKYTREHQRELTEDLNKRLSKYGLNIYYQP